MVLQLRISGIHHDVLQQHLLTEDGKEAMAVALCGRFQQVGLSILTVHDITLIPHNECYTRAWDQLCWPTERIMC